MIYEDHGPVGMTRRPDHGTSVLAARKVRRVTLREAVTDYAQKAGARGFIDDDLKINWPDSPESSLRKRRTELAQENVLIDSGRTWLNRHGQSEIVWVHREFWHNPPPIQARDTSPKQSRLVRAEAEVERLKAILDANNITH